MKSQPTVPHPGSLTDKKYIYFLSGNVSSNAPNEAKFGLANMSNNKFLDTSFLQYHLSQIRNQIGFRHIQKNNICNGSYV